MILKLKRDIKADEVWLEEKEKRIQQMIEKFKQEKELEWLAKSKPLPSINVPEANENGEFSYYSIMAPNPPKEPDFLSEPVRRKVVY